MSSPEEPDEFEEYLHVTVQNVQGEVEHEKEREQPNEAHLRYLEGKLIQALYIRDLYLRQIKGR